MLASSKSTADRTFTSMNKRKAPILQVVAAVGVLATTLPSGSAVIGEPDRQTIAEWAISNHLDVSLVEDRFAATGVVTCEWDDVEHGHHTTIASGQVTGRQDLITLSAHTFFDPFECIPRATPSNCEFTVQRNGSYETAEMTEIVSIGYDCSAFISPIYGDRLLNDWAIVRLDRTLDVVPYAISGDTAGAVAEDIEVVSVVHSQDYLVVDPEGGTLHPKTVSQCTIRDLLRRAGRTVYFTSDCDGAQRSSGGSVLDDTGETPILIGVWAASSEDRRMLDEAVGRILEAGQYGHDLVNGGNYEVNDWSSRHVPVAGAFLRAVREAAQPG